MVYMCFKVYCRSKRAPLSSKDYHHHMIGSVPEPCTRRGCFSSSRSTQLAGADGNAGAGREAVMACMCRPAGAACACRESGGGLWAAVAHSTQATADGGGQDGAASCDASPPHPW